MWFADKHEPVRVGLSEEWRCPCCSPKVSGALAAALPQSAGVTRAQLHIRTATKISGKRDDGSSAL